MLTCRVIAEMGGHRPQAYRPILPLEMKSWRGAIAPMPPSAPAPLHASEV